MIIFCEQGHRTFRCILMIKCDFDLFLTRFARAGADITQTFTYYSRDVGVPEGCTLTCQQINQVRFFLLPETSFILDPRRAVTLPSKLREKREQLSRVGLSRLLSSNMSRFSKENFFEFHPPGQTGRKGGGAKGTWRRAWGSHPEQHWPHHCWGFSKNFILGNKRFNDSHAFLQCMITKALCSTSTTSAKWNGP